MDDYTNFQIILKVNSSNIHLQGYDEKLSINKMHSYRIYCHDLGEASNFSDKLKVFVLNESNNKEKSAGFQHQKPIGEPIGPKDYTIFMTPTYEAGRKASYAIDLGISMHSTSLENLSKEECRKLGTAYMYLDPGFSTQGFQRMQIIGAHTFSPIGSLQVEYLIVKNPIAAGIPSSKPKWLSAYPFLHQGHRGAGSGCRADLDGKRITENSIASFNFASQHGADMCELDVMVTLDGVPVVYHDFKLDVQDLGMTQIDQLTLDDLRTYKLANIHDKNCKHNQERSGKEYNLTIPTLEEVLIGVNPACGLNIELKFPQLLANGKSEAQQFREINDHVDRILNCIDEFENNRPIMLSTMNVDIAFLLRLKQTRYPVLFITTGDSNRFADPFTKTVQNGIQFVKAFDMAGINPNVAYLNEKMVRFAQDRGLLVYAWGKIDTVQAVKEYKRFGMNGLIYDRIDLIKPTD